MKSKLLLAGVLALFLSLGTLLVESQESPETLRELNGCLNISDPISPDVCKNDYVPPITKGFPFSYTENYVESLTGEGDSIQAQGVTITANFLSWFFFVLLGLFAIDFLAGVVGKIVVRILIGLAAAAYGLFILTG